MRSAVVLFCALYFCSTTFAETLKDILSKHKVPLQSFSTTELETKVSPGDGQIKTVPDLSLLAYPSVVNGNFGPLFVIRHDGKSGRVIHQLLSSPQVSDVCLGPVWGIEEQAGK